MDSTGTSASSCIDSLTNGSKLTKLVDSTIIAGTEPTESCATTTLASLPNTKARSCNDVADTNIERKFWSYQTMFDLKENSAKEGSSLQAEYGWQGRGVHTEQGGTIDLKNFFLHLQISSRLLCIGQDEMACDGA
ncbi:hypothetical protein OGATHE_000647 [Ogataea polymorpha]|uniref:Uncharacterized protein n=1 Tax=Ogataea polymorpha TaxID=460523 RepID=A0A9P8PTS4_9ASCO|nr:hypothetical protein OGATHE_000647 [Ogataea polymorpha]